ncbi:MAG: sterol desaturase family protein [Myxococcota bacterium]
MSQFIEYASLSFLPLFLILDIARRRLASSTTKRWRIRALAVTAVTISLSFAIAAFWAGVFEGVSLLPGHGLGTAAGVLVGILVYELLHYAYHRAAFVSFGAVFQHANIHTPQWLGYIVQRPESHSVHHGREPRRLDFANLPLWDMIFGTFENPERFEPEVGFYEDASARVAEMLIGRDVSELLAQQAGTELRTACSQPTRRPVWG